MLKRFLLLLLTLSCFAFPASATWSIILVNRRTGEVAVGAATCIPRSNLTVGLPAVVVGKGAGVMQAISGFEFGLTIIADGLASDVDPATILAQVAAADPSIQSRQIGIVGMTGSPVTFTGNFAGQARGGAVGEVGDLAYAIQGNVLTSIQVVLAAEQALLNTEGDTGQKLMAAMVAARELGGDGRCSCSLSVPDGCGAPPESFEKSAHCGFVLVARKGDRQSPCVTGNDCASTGNYLRLIIRGPNALQNSPDPVDQLVDLYATWRANRVGRPDGLLSVLSQVDPMPADGVTQQIVTVQLVDLEGDPLTGGGADVQVAPLEGTTPSATIGSVTDNGDGTYSFPVTAGTEVGTDAFVITAADDFLTATLHPCLEIESVQAGPLAIGRSELSASAGGTVPFTLDLPERPFGLYWILGSLSGTEPGVDLGPFLHIPLNPDRVTLRTLVLAGRPDVLPGTFGWLDGEGHADAALVARPNMLLDLVGLRLDWAGLVLRFGAPPVATNAVGFDIVP